MSLEPLVSTVIPLYNRRAYLAEAIDSVLGQASARTEVIVVDDGSTDGSAEVVRGYGGVVRCIAHDRNRGIGAARNTGVAAATGTWLAFLDADDLWSLDKISLQLSAFEQEPDLDIAFGMVSNFVSPDLPAEAAGRIQCPRRPLPGLLPGAALMRLRTFKAVGPFTESLSVGEFVDWYARARELGLRARVLPDVVLRRRLHASNQGIVHRQDRSDYLTVLRAALERRRNP